MTEGVQHPLAFDSIYLKFRVNLVTQDISKVNVLVGGNAAKCGPTPALAAEQPLAAFRRRFAYACRGVTILQGPGARPPLP
jgi:hypothetical protein